MIALLCTYFLIFYVGQEVFVWSDCLLDLGTDLFFLCKDEQTVSKRGVRRKPTGENIIGYFIFIAVSFANVVSWRKQE